MAETPGRRLRRSSSKTSETSPIARSCAEHCAVGGDDAARLLPAVLQLVEAEVGEPRGVVVPVDAEHAALVAEAAPQDFARAAFVWSHVADRLSLTVFEATL